MRASCSPQSELRLVLMGLAPPCGLAALCTSHCIMSVARGVKGHADLTSSPPSSLLTKAVPREKYNTRQGLRSFPDLTEHITARADDNHAAPVLHSRRSPDFSGFAVGFQALVRFLAY